MSDSDTTAVRQWVRENAHPLHDLSALPAIVGDAQVVGIGETTRASHEIDHHRLRVLQVLVEELGFRTLAINEDAIVAERLDDLVRGSGDDPAETLGAAWPPWRTEETVRVLQWIRAYNEDHPGDPVRLLGVNRPGAQQYHYDAVIDYVRRAAPQRLDAVKAHLAPPRSAHQIDEHLQRFRGIHPGRPFADSARDAYELVAALPEDGERHHVLRYAQTIVDHHSIHGRRGPGLRRVDGPRRRHDPGAPPRHRRQDRLLGRHRDDRERPGHEGRDRRRCVRERRRPPAGPARVDVSVDARRLREGEIHEGVTVPTPPADYVETDLAADEAYYLDLRAAAPDAVAGGCTGATRSG